MDIKTLSLGTIPAILSITLLALVFGGIVDLPGNDKSPIFALIFAVWGVIHLVVFWLLHYFGKRLKVNFWSAAIVGLILCFPLTMGIVIILVPT